ncbi:MAG TPA: nicotinate-nucleotide--dimethylbenzimidazole phosphoribosyltransferase [Dissulfurispiraceae bacterium]|nr:nicotinate-nucleotide--dimethylbenzimidazole phosphoribosyltransferase [Dissulfurispiraceae bacterium]
MTLLTETVGHIAPLDEHFFSSASKRLDNLTKPPGSLGRLEEFARQMVAISANEMPTLPKKIVFTFAGDHGVTEQGISAFPKEVTRQMVLNFLSGGAGINVLARHAGADVAVVDIGVDHDFGPVEGLLRRKVLRGTRNFMKGPAMTHAEAVRCVEVGIELADEYAAKGYSLFGTGEMGIGNTTSSSAIASVMTGLSASAVTGRGTGISDAALNNKVCVVEAGIRVNNPDPLDALDVLAKVGGAEIGGIAGLILGAAANRIPIVIDGFISTAGALIAFAIEPITRDYMFAAHASVEIGHRAMLEKIGLQPILDLNLRLGEGTGAALAMMLIEGGLKIYREMATFGEAGVSGGS